MRPDSGTRAKGRVNAIALLLGLGLLPAAATAQVVTTLAGSGAVGSADGTGAAASFNWPFGVAVDGSGNVYVADADNNRIRIVSAAGLVSTLAGSGVVGSADGLGPVASFRNPSGVTVDGAGNVYVADTCNHKIRKISPGGLVTTFAGSGVAGSSDGTGTAASFANPVGLATGGSGNLYVADASNNRIRMISPAGIVTTLAGSGDPGSADGAAAASSFFRPYGVAVDATGVVYVADNLNHRIRKISPVGIVTTLAGSGESGSADGTAAAATFSYPLGVAADAAGSVYVADFQNNRIRKIASGGAVSTLAGSGALGSKDGTGAAASFRCPGGVALDAAGNVYVGDSGNNRIRKITPPKGTCTPDALTACLIGGRYQVTSHWRNQHADGQVSALSAARLTDATAAFWLSDADAFEYLIRINTATDNGRAWISIPTFTDVEFWIAVTDLTSGQTFEYHSPAGNRTLLYDPGFFVYP